MNQYLCILLGGCLGTLGRFGVHTILVSMFSFKPANATLGINLLGCFLIGYVSQGRLIPEIYQSPAVKLGVTVGFLGAFTTFSTFALDTFRQLEMGAWPAASMNLLIHVLGGLFFVWVGFRLGA